MSCFAGKTLLITGGTGSFGNMVLKRFLESDIKEIRIFSRDEKKQDDMRHHLQSTYSANIACKVKFYIGDVRDRKSVDIVMRCGLRFLSSCPQASSFLRVLPNAGCRDQCIWHK